jgi:hypothetical protein
VLPSLLLNVEGRQSRTFPAGETEDDSAGGGGGGGIVRDASGLLGCSAMTRGPSESSNLGLRIPGSEAEVAAVPAVNPVAAVPAVNPPDP